MRHRRHHRLAQRRKAVERQRLPDLRRQRPQDRPVLARLARRKARAVRHLRPPLGVDEDPRLLDPGRPRQDHVRPVRTPVAVAPLIDHERPGRHVDLVGAEVVDHLCPIERRVEAAVRRAPDVHRANPARRRMQHQQLRGRRLAEGHDGTEHRLAVRAGQRPLPDDHHRRHVLDVVVAVLADQRLERLAPGPEVVIGIGEVHRLADHRNARPRGPHLADARVQHRRLDPRVGPDQHDPLRRVDIGNRRRPDIAATVPRRQLRPVRPALDRPAEPRHQFLQREGRFGRHQIADQPRDLPALHRPGNRPERLAPGRRLQPPADTNVQACPAAAAAARPRRSATDPPAIPRSRRHGCAA